MGAKILTRLRGWLSESLATRFGVQAREARASLATRFGVQAREVRASLASRFGVQALKVSVLPLPADRAVPMAVDLDIQHFALRIARGRFTTDRAASARYHLTIPARHDRTWAPGRTLPPPQQSLGNRAGQRRADRVALPGREHPNPGGRRRSGRCQRARRREGNPASPSRRIDRLSRAVKNPSHGSAISSKNRHFAVDRSRRQPASQFGVTSQSVAKEPVRPIDPPGILSRHRFGTKVALKGAGTGASPVPPTPAGARV